MRHHRNATIALVAISGAALIGSAASAQAPYGYDRGASHGSYSSYGADRANPSMSPNGFDQDIGRDRQLDGRN